MLRLAFCLRGSTNSPATKSDARQLKEFLPTLRSRFALYVPSPSFLATCAFIAGYRWGAADLSFAGFHNWLVARGYGRPELGWPWLVLCELYSDVELPEPRRFTEEQDREAIAVMFDLLEEFYDSQG